MQEDNYDKNYYEEKNEITLYAPEFSPLWEKLIGPGAIAASVIAVILTVMALIITYNKPKHKVVSYTTTTPVIEEDKPDDLPIVIEPPEMETITEIEVEIKLELTADSLANPSEINFSDVNNDPTNQKTIDFQPNSFMGPNHFKAGDGGGDKYRRTSGFGPYGITKNIGPPGKPEAANALHWLRRHQSKNGSWKLKNYTRECSKENKHGKCAGLGNSHFNNGASSLALLAYTGQGLDHLAKGLFQSTIKRSMNYLLSTQNKKTGCFGKPEGEHLYNQSLCTLALADLLLMSEDKKLRAPVQKGVDYLLNAQNDENSGHAWRYNNYNKYPEAKQVVEDGQLNDTSVTAWVVMALKTAKGCELKVDDKGFKGASQWLDSCYKETKTGKYDKEGAFAYNMINGKQAFAYKRPYATTACGVLSRQFMRETEGVTAGCNTLLKSLPDWNGTRNLYYWYYGSLAMFQMGGDHWDQWAEAMLPALTQNQCRRRNECRFGSWDPEGSIWGEDFGGRVYSTAISALTLEVWYRYAKIK